MPLRAILWSATGEAEQMGAPALETGVAPYQLGHDGASAVDMACEVMLQGLESGGGENRNGAGSEKDAHR